VLGGGSISGTTYTPDAVTADTNVTIKYTVAANGSCASTNSDVTFTVNPFAGTANNTTSTAAICSTDTKTLSATPAGGTWSIVLGGGSISGTTYTPDAVTADTNVTIKYTVAANGSCASTNSDVTFTVFALPVKPTLSAVTQQTCTNPKGSVTITDYDPAYTYTITPSLGVIQNNDTVTAPVGSYSITASVNGCTSDISNFTINSKICAADDNTYLVQIPSYTTATTVGNVTANDKLNGVDVTALNTTVTAITTGPLSIDASGVLTLDPNTVSGTYTITYQICEKGANPVNCDTAEATVVVKGTLVANDDSYTATPGTTVATTVGNVTANDKLNGVDV
ncbi:hypothetical protein, partial [Flavobacterium bizetiae]|uniref:hypothetical protein n=1 Tax=Flavobacterium bizetiae TaxID=2704140 RepID=UPI00374318C9